MERELTVEQAKEVIRVGVRAGILSMQEANNMEFTKKDMKKMRNDVKKHIFDEIGATMEENGYTYDETVEMVDEAVDDVVREIKKLNKKK